MDLLQPVLESLFTAEKAFVMAPECPREMRSAMTSNGMKKNLTAVSLTFLRKYYDMALGDLMQISAASQSDYIERLLLFIIQCAQELSRRLCNEVLGKPGAQQQEASLTCYDLDALYFSLALYRKSTEHKDVCVKCIQSLPQSSLLRTALMHFADPSANPCPSKWTPGTFTLLVPERVADWPDPFDPDAVKILHDIIAAETDGVVGVRLTKHGRSLYALKDIAANEMILEDPTDLTVATSDENCASCGLQVSSLGSAITCPDCDTTYCSEFCLANDMNSHHTHSIICAIRKTPLFSFARAMSQTALRSASWGGSSECSEILLQLMGFVAGKIIKSDFIGCTGLWRVCPELFLLSTDKTVNRQWLDLAELSNSPLRDVRNDGATRIDDTLVSLLLMAAMIPSLRVWPHLRPSVLNCCLTGVMLNGFATVSNGTGIFHLSCYQALANHCCTPNFRRAVVHGPGGFGTLLCLRCVHPCKAGDDIEITYTENDTKLTGSESQDTVSEIGIDDTPTPDVWLHRLHVLASHNIDVCTCDLCKEMLRNCAKSSGSSEK